MSQHQEQRHFSQFGGGYESPLSNLRFSDFTLDGIQYNSVEQCFQYLKAEYFGEYDLMRDIIQENISPIKCRELGQKINTREPPIDWFPTAIKIMENACLAKVKIFNEIFQFLLLNSVFFKFIQNEGPRKYLFKTGDSTLVCCEPLDRFWSSGLRKYDPRLRNPNEWPGRNELGEILRRVRDGMIIRPEYKDILKTIEKEDSKRWSNTKPRKEDTENPPAKEYRTMP